MSENLLRPNLDNLQVGDTVYVLKAVKDVWTHFRYELISKERIVRITPKRTKIVTNEGTYDCKYYNPFVIPDVELKKKHNITKAFIKVRNARDDFSKQDLFKFTNEELLELAEISEQLQDVFEKHNNAK